MSRRGVATADRARARRTSSGFAATISPGFADRQLSALDAVGHVRHGTLSDGSLRSLRIALWSPPTSSSFADEKRVPSLLLSTAARDPRPGRRASSLGNAMLPRLGCMSGLLRPVGPGARADLLGAARTRPGRNDGARGRCGLDHQRHQQRLGSSSKSVAFHRRVFGAESGITKLDAGSHAKPDAAYGTPSAIDPSGSASSTTPEPKATTRKASTKKTDRSSPVDCPAEELRPTLTGKQRLAPKQPTTFQLSLINGSDQTCIARVTRKNFELKIYSGSDRIWSTADCRSAIKPISRKLASEHAVAWSLTWDGKRSKSNCKSAQEAPRPGTYVATAQLEGAEPVQLRMLLSD